MVSSLALAILTFAGMQMFKDQLSAEGGMTILGGFLGSWFFVFLLNVGEQGVGHGGLYLELLVDHCPLYFTNYCACIQGHTLLYIYNRSLGTLECCCLVIPILSGSFLKV